MHLEDRPAALKWIKQNQRARRNLTPEEMAVLIGNDYREAKQPHGGQIPNTKAVDEGSGHSDHLDKTEQQVAEKHGVSASTVKRNAAFAKAVETIGKNAGQEVVESILSGKTDKSRKDVIVIAKLPPEEQAAAIIKRMIRTNRSIPWPRGTSYSARAAAGRSFPRVSNTPQTK